MEFQGLEGVDLGRNLRMVQSLERPEGCGQFLNANFGIGGREVLGLGLGVGRRGMSKNESEMMRVSQLERGDPVGWRSLEGHTGGITEVLPIEGRTDHIEPGMAMILEGTVSRHDVRAPQGEGQRGEGTELSGREQRDTLRIQSVDGLQVMNERGTSGRIGMGGERWRHGGRGLNVQDWSKHGFEGKGNEEQEINLAATKTDDSSLQVLYRECQRNLGLGKGATVLDGCGEFMACREEGIPDALKCGACSCHRNFHRRIVIRRDEVVWEQREDVARELEEALSTIRKIGDDIKTSAGRALPLLSQEKRSLQGRDISHQNHAALFKSCVQALGQVANAMLATSDCLALLQKSNGGHTVCPQDTRRIEELKRLPALITSSDASPVNKSEQKLGSPTSFPPQKSPSTTFSSPMFGWQGSTDQCVSDRAPLTPAAEGGYNEQKQKRKRTRFTFEQLKKLNDFAARTGWTLAGVAKEEIDAVCTDIGIGSVTLKYWIHNMRQKSKRRHEDGKKTPPATP